MNVWEHLKADLGVDQRLGAFGSRSRGRSTFGSIQCFCIETETTGQKKENRKIWYVPKILQCTAVEDLVAMKINNLILRNAGLFLDDVI